MAEERLFTCNLCDAMCGLRVAVDGNRVLGVRGDERDVHSRGHICPKAVGLKELLEDPDRVRAPLMRTANGLERTDWESAFSVVTRELDRIRRKHGPHSVAIYVGNPVVHSHRAALGSQLLTAALGTHNRFDPNSQDSNARLYSALLVFGDPLSIPVPDVDRTDFLMMLGANPAVSNGSMLGLGHAKERIQGISRRGGRVVLLDPRRTETAAWATEHHFIRPGSDAALLLAMLNVLFSTERVNANARANGIEKLREISRAFTPERVSVVTGMSPSTIRSLAIDFSSSRTACAYPRVGVCQNAFGAMACWLVDALNALTGNLDRAGGAMFPSPAADLAPLGRLVNGDEIGRWKSRVRGLPEFLGSLPSSVMAEEMDTPGDGQIRALVCLAGNPVLSTPNGARLSSSLERLEFMTSIDFYVHETSRHAHVILPPKHIFEVGNFDVLLSRFTVRNGVKYSAPILETDDDTRDDFDIASELAMRLRAPRAMHPVMRKIARKAPERFIDLMLRTGPRKLSLDDVKRAQHGIDFGPMVPSWERVVHTRDGRVNLAPQPLVDDVARLAKWVDEARVSTELVMIGRRHLRGNNSWNHNLPSLAKGPDRSKLMMHPGDAATRGIVDGAMVRVKSRTGSVEVRVMLSDDVMKGVVSLPHGYGHQDAKGTLRVAGALPGPSANAITDELLVEPLLGTSILSGVPVQVERAGE